MLNEYADLFLEPTILPPYREHDHRILLKPDAKPVNVRPYKHSPIQKDLIEKMIQEQLVKRIIQPSVSPFSSPIVLVKKKDNS